MQLKGRRKVQSTLIEKTAKAMNEGDAYLLYSRDTLYVFYGQEANRMVRFFFFFFLPPCQRYTGVLTFCLLGCARAGEGQGPRADQADQLPRMRRKGAGLHRAQEGRLRFQREGRKA